jgi:hypothetical protein
MAKVIFRTSHMILGAGEDGQHKLYKAKPEPQEVPDECFDNWFMKCLLKNGNVIPALGSNIKMPEGPFCPPSPPKKKVVQPQKNG